MHQSKGAGRAGSVTVWGVCPIVINNFSENFATTSSVPRVGVAGRPALGRIESAILAGRCDTLRVVVEQRGSTKHVTKLRTVCITTTLRQRYKAFKLTLAISYMRKSRPSG